jgi:hypothetical protein
MIRNTLGSRSRCKYRLTEDFTTPLVKEVLPLVKVTLKADMRADSDIDREDHVDMLVRYKGSWGLMAVRIRCWCYRHYSDLTMTSTHKDGTPGESKTAETELYFYGWADHHEPRLNEFLLADMKGLRDISLQDAMINGTGQKFSVCSLALAQSSGLILEHKKLASVYTDAAFTA